MPCWSCVFEGIEWWMVGLLLVRQTVVEVLWLFFHHREVLPRKKLSLPPTVILLRVVTSFTPWSRQIVWQGSWNNAARTVHLGMWTSCHLVVSAKWHGDLDSVSPHLLFTSKRLKWNMSLQKAESAEPSIWCPCFLLRVCKGMRVLLLSSWTRPGLQHASWQDMKRSLFATWMLTTLRLLLQSSFIDGARYQRHSSRPCGWSLDLLQFDLSCQGKFKNFFQGFQFPAPKKYDPSVFFFLQIFKSSVFPARRRFSVPQDHEGRDLVTIDGGCCQLGLFCPCPCGPCSRVTFEIQ